MRILFTSMIVLFAVFITNNITAQTTRLFYTAQEGGTADKYDTNAVYISMFPKFKADFERICGIAVAFNTTTMEWEATCSNRPFTAADTGKILVVKNARSYPAYRKAPFTLNAIIKWMEGSAHAVIESIDGFGVHNSFAGAIKAVINECGFLATDNFEVIQQAIDTCAAMGKRKLIMNYRGTAYLVPQRSIRPMPKSYQQILVVNNNLELRGYDSSITKMKWGLEDISRVDENTNPYYAAFTIQGSTFSLKKMTLLSPDRGITNVDHQNLECLTGNADNTSVRTGQNIMIDSSGIISEDGNGFEGWGRSIYMNGSLTINATDTSIQSVKNSLISAQAGPAYFSRKPYTENVAFVATDTLNRLQRIHKTLIKGGARYTKKAFGVEIHTGSNIVVVHDPNFSFYDHTDYEVGGNYRIPVLFIARETYIPLTARDTSTIYQVQVLQVVNDSTAILDTTSFEGAPRWSTSNATFYTFRDGGGCSTAFHTLYITGNLGADNLNSTFIPLRTSRNVQSTCASPMGTNFCGSFLVKDAGNQGLFYNAAIYPNAAELKVIVVGVGFGFVVSSAGDYFFPAPQKY